MREILFRGKRLDNGEWVEGWIVPVSHNTYLKGFEIINSEGINYDEFDNYAPSYSSEVVDPETVGQFTGLTDKNGKKIFEGDIIRYADIYDYNCYLESLENPEAYEGTEYSDIWTIDEVVCGIAINYPAFDLNRHSFEVNGLSELSESGGYFYEVIGNIHDNPELLKGVR